MKIFLILKKNIDISKSSNIKIVKCIQKIFTVKIFSENYGFYLSFFMNFFNILILIFSPISKIEKEFNKFCSNILTQMKKVYNKIENSEKTTFGNNQNDYNAEIHDFSFIRNQFDEITQNNSVIDNSENNNDINENKEKNDENNNDINENNNYENRDNNHANGNDNNNGDNINNIQKENGKIKSKSNQLVLKEQKKYSLIKNNKIITKKSIGIYKKKFISNISSTYRRMNTPEINDNNLNINIINKDKSEIENYKKIVEELKKKDDSEYYIYYLIKNFQYKSRRYLLTQSEIQNLDYKYALKIDNMNNGDYYFELLKEKNKIISIFLNKSDFNIQAVKISLFIFNFNLSLTTNALFFNDVAIHQINQDEGSFNLKTQITTVLYSTIISTAIGFIIEYFAQSSKSILNLRNKKDIKEVEKEIPELIKKLKLKYKIFFASTIIINAIFWYYITSFCAIYSIIQAHMISDSLISFLLSISYSILLSLISSIIRVASLKRGSKIRHYFYTLSWIISLI